MGVTDEESRRLAADPRFNVALEASAGTGKTTVLVDRYLRLVEEGASPRHILAITFTRKAAGEMKSRIVSELKARRDLWQDIKQRLSEIHITTIDAFCLGLLREFPLEAGLDPDLELLDEVDTERFIAETVEDALALRDHSGVDLTFLLTRFGERTLGRGLRDLLRARLVKKDVLSRFVARRVPKGLDLLASLRRVSDAYREAFRGSQGLERFIDTGPTETNLDWRALVYALGRSIDRKRASAFDIEEVARYFLTQHLEPRKRLSPICGRTDFRSSDDYVRHRERVLALAPLIANAYRTWVREKDLYAIGELTKLYRQVAASFESRKQRRAGLDFSDILEKAVALLEKRDEFSLSRFRLESRYHHLLVDEFQDTNDVQWRLVRALIESWGEGAGLVQEAILAEQAEGRGQGFLQEPSIFIVGDRKQSIYGWRDARVEVMEKAARHLVRLRSGGGKRLTIRTSFRARGELLDFLNDLFAEVPKARQNLDWSFQYREEDHFPVTDKEDKSERPVALAVAADPAGTATLVGDEVVRLLEEERLHPGEIAILFRSRAAYRVYETALVERGVPTYVYRGLGFFDSPEVRDVEALVRFLSEPASELRAAELARSRLVGVSDTALALLASTNRRSNPTPISRWLRGEAVDTHLPLPAADRAAAMKSSELVPGWLALVDHLPPADLLQQVLQGCDYAHWFAGQEQGWENLKKILELVRRAQNRGYLTMSRLAEYLDNASAGEESLAVLEAVDAVNLMTIHAAKGLEFDTVFLVNMEQATRQDTSLPRIRERGDGQIEVSALPQLDEMDSGPDRIGEEEKRLLYVALTRARRRLVLSANRLGQAEGRKSFYHLLPETFQNLLVEARDGAADTLTWSSKRGEHRIRVLRLSATPKRYRSDEPPTPFRPELEPLQPGTVRSSERELRRPATDAFNVSVEEIVYRLLELDAPVDDRLPEKAAALTAGITLPSDQLGLVEDATDLYRRLRQNDVLESLLTSGEIYRKVELVSRRGEDTVLRAVIDCIVVGTERAVVIDVKTGTAQETDSRQMELCLEAVAELFPRLHVEGAIVYSRGELIFVRRKDP